MILYYHYYIIIKIKNPSKSTRQNPHSREGRSDITGRELSLMQDQAAQGCNWCDIQYSAACWLCFMHLLYGMCCL